MIPSFLFMAIALLCLVQLSFQAAQLPQSSSSSSETTILTSESVSSSSAIVPPPSSAVPPPPPSSQVVPSTATQVNPSSTESSSVTFSGTPLQIILDWGVFTPYTVNSQVQVKAKNQSGSSITVNKLLLIIDPQHSINVPLASASADGSVTIGPGQTVTLATYTIPCSINGLAGLEFVVFNGQLAFGNSALFAINLDTSFFPRLNPIVGPRLNNSTVSFTLSSNCTSNYPYYVFSNVTVLASYQSINATAQLNPVPFIFTNPSFTLTPSWPIDIAFIGAPLVNVKIGFTIPNSAASNASYQTNSINITQFTPGIVTFPPHPRPGQFIIIAITNTSPFPFIIANIILTSNGKFIFLSYGQVKSTNASPQITVDPGQTVNVSALLDCDTSGISGTIAVLDPNSAVLAQSPVQIANDPTLLPSMSMEPSVSVGVVGDSFNFYIIPHCPAGYPLLTFPSVQVRYTTPSGQTTIFNASNFSFSTFLAPNLLTTWTVPDSLAGTSGTIEMSYQFTMNGSTSTVTFDQPLRIISKAERARINAIIGSLARNRSLRDLTRIGAGVYLYRLPLKKSRAASLCSQFGMRTLIITHLVKKYLPRMLIRSENEKKLFWSVFESRIAQVFVNKAAKLKLNSKPMRKAFVLCQA